MKERLIVAPYFKMTPKHGSGLGWEIFKLVSQLEEINVNIPLTFWPLDGTKLHKWAFNDYRYHVYKKIFFSVSVQLT